jgi:hypothetical protein
MHARRRACLRKIRGPELAGAFLADSDVLNGMPAFYALSTARIPRDNLIHDIDYSVFQRAVCTVA